MNHSLAIRALSLYAPVSVAFLLWILRPPQRRTAPAVLLAFLWTLPTLLLLQRANQHFGWWTFHTAGPTLRGFPVELYLGWAVLWSAVPVLALRRALPATLVLLTLDLAVMPRCAPVVILNPHWLYGEAAAALLILLPATLLAQWTREDRRLPLRAAMQLLIAAGLFLYLPPEVLFALRGGSWHVHPAMQLLFFLAIPGLSAVQEFAERGQGTPIPYDPPKALVTTGLYRFVANPMQLSCTLVILIWGIFERRPWLAALAFISLAYSAGLARWDEHEDLAQRFGAPWLAYRAAVKDWLPRWHPHIALPATLFIAQTCGPCSQLQRLIESLHPSGLTIAPAELYPGGLRRMRYAVGEYHADGVEALARTLEHLNFATALLGAAMRLPIIRPVMQRIADAIGFGEQAIGGETVCSPAKRYNRRRRPTGWFAALG